MPAGIGVQETKIPLLVLLQKGKRKYIDFLVLQYIFHFFKKVDFLQVSEMAITKP